MAVQGRLAAALPPPVHRASVFLGRLVLEIGLEAGDHGKVIGNPLHVIVDIFKLLVHRQDLGAAGHIMAGCAFADLCLNAAQSGRVAQW